MLPVATPWGLREKPFEPVTDSRFFFQSRFHEETLARLNYLVNEETMYLGMLSGEIGCGKSLVRQVFAAGLDAGRHVLVPFENSCFTFEEHLQRLLQAFGLGRQAAAAAGSSYALYELTRSVLHQLKEDYRRHLVLVFDEAQDLSPEALAGLKRLSNLNEEGVGRLTVILIGQPELRQCVRRLPALDQRISLRFHLRPFALDDTRDYVRHRLRTAGHPSGDLFEEPALEVVFRHSGGVPREINRLAKLALESAHHDGAAAVETRHVRAVVEDLRRHQAALGLEAVAS